MGDEVEGEKAPHERDGGLPFTMEFNYTGAAFLRQFEVLWSTALKPQGGCWRHGG